MSKTVTQGPNPNAFFILDNSNGANGVMQGIMLVDPATGAGYMAGSAPALGNVLVRTVTIATDVARVDYTVNFNGAHADPITTILSVTAQATGAGTKQLKFGNSTQDAVTVADGTVIDGLSNTTGLLLESDGAGGSITLIVSGR